MDNVYKNSKKYDYLSVSHEPSYQVQIDSINIVKQFIIDNNLIVYGGSAIDYALRLKGDRLYPDEILNVPDLDVYSDDSVNLSYKLADILYHKGYNDARSINAVHVKTMRVDVIDNHFIADISYKPPSLFKSLPFLTYSGMRIIDPIFLRIDIHSSLSFPYDNVPQEVVFARWSKDIERFNLLNKYYPLATPGETISLRNLEVPITKYVFAGFAAYALIYKDYQLTMEKLGAKIPSDVIPSKCELGTSLTFETLDQQLELIHFDAYELYGKLSDALSLANKRTFRPLSGMTYERIDAVASFGILTIHNTKDKLTSVNTISSIGADAKVRVVNVQFLLKHFISMSFIKKDTPKIANTYVSRYISLIKMIESLGKALSDLPREEAEAIAMESPLYPSVKTFGYNNINLSRKIALSRLYGELDGVETYITPRNYYPGRSIPNNRPHPTFTYTDLEFFLEDGGEILPEPIKENTEEIKS